MVGDGVVRSADVDTDDIDAPIRAREGDAHRLGQIVDGQVEVTGEKVAGAGGQDRQGNVGVGQSLGNGAHCAIASRRQDDRSTLGQRALRLT